MARYSKASWRPLKEQNTQPKIDPTQVILHSAVDAPGPTSLFGYFNRDDVKVEAHFFIRLDGAVEQYLDTTIRADANRYANVRAVSIETEDDGDPNNRMWSAAQVASIKALLAWLWRVHPKIERRVCPRWDAPGVGYHTMFGAPSMWTPVVKTCPGVIRKLQFSSTIEPWIRGYKPPVAPAPAPKPVPQEVYVDVRVRQLRIGSSGGDVKSLQALLNAKAGQGLRADGVFGPKTDRAVKNVQRWFRLSRDGIVGPKTWGALFL